MTVPKWVNNNLFEMPPLWSKKRKPKQLNGLSFMLLSCFGFYWLTGSGQWPGYLVKKSAMENCARKATPVWGMALWKALWEFEGCIKIGYVNAHQKNPLLSLEGDWNQLIDILVCLPKVLFESMKWMDIRQLQQHRDRLNLDMFLLQPLRPKMPISAVLFARKRDTLQILGLRGRGGLK